MKSETGLLKELINFIEQKTVLSVGWFLLVTAGSIISYICGSVGLRFNGLRMQAVERSMTFLLCLVTHTDQRESRATYKKYCSTVVHECVKYQNVKVTT